ncbi:MAG: calcium-translocating P-type ATPase, PMCA-type [Flavobacteriales bacterium]|nr:calcium-translocating P-type ATPase, PMCA-type [Flavobacteriales bacterium]
MQNKTKGLTEEQVLKSREIHGDNMLTPVKKRSAWYLLAEKFTDPIIQILIVAAGLSLVIAIADGHYVETIGIVSAIILSTLIGFFFEWDAGKKFDILSRVNDTIPVKVYRNGQVCEVPKNEIVVDDVVVLSQGDEVPADGELMLAVALGVNESVLTGEPMVSKTTEKEEFDSAATYPSNMVMRGTTITDGYGEMRVTAVGDATEYGRVARESSVKNEEQTPLARQLDGLAQFISVVGFASAMLIFLILFAKDMIWGLENFSVEQTVSLTVMMLSIIIIGLKVWVKIIYRLISLRKKEEIEPLWVKKIPQWTLVVVVVLLWGVMMTVEYAFDINPLADENYVPLSVLSRILGYVMVAVTLIVVVVPEGLPMSVTLSLALSMRRMLSANNLVRKMHACETMGAITVICTDKTGTLTQNKMQVQDVFFPSSEKNIHQCIAVNSTAFLDIKDEKNIHVIGNPTEGALLLWSREHGEDYIKTREKYHITDQMPFSTATKYMASVAQADEKEIIFVKGAPEVVLAMCGAEKDEQILKTLAQYQNKAMRTLALAYADVEKKEGTLAEKISAKKLTLICVVAISDPVRQEVPRAISDCKSAGIRVCVVTGDTSATAREIARQIGLWDEKSSEENMITGADFAALDDQKATEVAGKLKIMSRARPLDKQRLVQLLQKKGEVVAVTGDGTNDAPALNFAHVGLSMGSGTEVAKQASDITIIDDSFASIASAVMWGRSLYKNIQRFMVFQLTINVIALLIVFLGSVFGTQMPLTVTQMLWVNIIMDTAAAAAFASLPPEKDVMRESPRDASAFIISKMMKNTILLTALLSTVVLLGLLVYFYFNGDGFTAVEKSIFFTVFIMMQVWNMLNVHAFATGKSAFYHLCKSRTFVLVVLLILLGQVLIVNYGGAVFSTVPLSAMQWLAIVLGTSVVLWVGETFRFFRRKKEEKI